MVCSFFSITSIYLPYSLTKPPVNSGLQLLSVINHMQPSALYFWDFNTPTSRFLMSFLSKRCLCMGCSVSILLNTLLCNNQIWGSQKSAPRWETHSRPHLERTSIYLWCDGHCPFKDSSPLWHKTGWKQKSQCSGSGLLRAKKWAVMSVVWPGVYSLQNNSVLGRPSQYSVPSRSSLINTAHCWISTFLL